MMNMPYHAQRGCVIYHGDCNEILPGLAGIDHMIADPPYSKRTHIGHDQIKGLKGRRGLSYPAWSVDDVMRFVEAQRLSVLGWRVIFSDHVLQPAWEAFLRAAGLYVFAPLPFVCVGARARLYGDGPASWSIPITVARSTEGRFLGWGSLPGAYVLPKGESSSRRKLIVGGKPLWLMRQLVRDYSRPGDTILDPVCGGGTTLLAAMQLGRKAVGIDRLEKMCELAALLVSDATNFGNGDDEQP